MIPEKILNSLKNSNALVTGGTGLIGRQVVELLEEAGAHVRIVSLDRLRVSGKAEHVYGDLTDFSFCRDTVKGMDYVFHLAGIKGSIEVTKARPASFFVPLLMMNTNLLEACRLQGVKRTVYTSSIGAYPSAEIFREDDDHADAPPMDFFPGWAKRMAELQLKSYQLEYGHENFAVVRPSNVYGPGDNFDPENAMVIPSLIARVFRKENPVMIWGDGSAVRDFVYSRDAAEGVILALIHGTAPGFVNIGSGEGVSIRGLVETLRTVTPFEYQFDIDKSSGFPRRVMDITRARQKIGYAPSVSLAEGLKKTCDWFMAHKDEYLLRKNYFADAAS